MTLHKITTMPRYLRQYNRATIILSFLSSHGHPLLGERIFQSTPVLSPRFLSNHRFTNSQQQKYLQNQKTEKNKLITYAEIKFPKATKLYKIIHLGIKDLISDFKTYISIHMKLKEHGFSKMTRQEIELYQKIPIEIRRIAPIFILAAIPFGNFIIFPLAFLKPKTLLSSHFWSPQQRIKFSEQDLKERLIYYRPVFSELRSKLDLIPDDEIKTKWKSILNQLKSGGQPTTADVSACKILFSREPYQLEKLTFSQMGYLLKMYGYKQSLFRRNKLKYIALLLLEMDKAIIREGGIDKLSPEALQHACYIRGLNTSNFSNQDMKNWLKRWLTLSTKVDKDSYSLILHGPILLGPNKL